ncbi:MAG: nucleotide sugar dehydrogenase [Vicinamibacteria bacterium]
MKVAVHGLWHLGCVTAACLAEGGHQVTALDPDADVVRELDAGRLPLHEPGLAELVAAGRAAGRLAFRSDLAALADVDALWVTLDTPVDDDDRADPDVVRRALDQAAAALPAGALVVVSSQVPVGFTRDAARAWPALRFACVPENLRLGRALDAFRRPERVVAGTVDASARDDLARLFAPFTSAIEWMGVESAEMAKHALNAFLATSVAFANEVARVCEQVGADAREVERGLRTDPRVGPKAYVSPGAAFAGGTLARDLRYLSAFGAHHRVATPLVEGVLASNAAHALAHRDEVRSLVGPGAVAAVLGLAYTPGTSTLRRSSSVELCRFLQGEGVRVRAHDPAVRALPDDLATFVSLRPDAADALDGADVAVVATAWPEYRELTADVVVAHMSRACVVDPARFLEATLGADPRVLYRATGRPRGTDA